MNIRKSELKFVWLSFFSYGNFAPSHRPLMNSKVVHETYAEAQTTNLLERKYSIARNYSSVETIIQSKDSENSERSGGITIIHSASAKRWCCNKTTQN